VSVDICIADALLAFLTFFPLRVWLDEGGTKGTILVVHLVYSSLLTELDLDPSSFFFFLLRGGKNKRVSKVGVFKRTIQVYTVANSPATKVCT
jgi:hypothetical protein